MTAALSVDGTIKATSRLRLVAFTAIVVGLVIRTVRLTRPLGDERRLRVLRRLTTGDHSLQELADHFQMPKTTLLHHLVMLRSVGIVRVSPGPNGKYSLRAGMPLELNRLLDRYLPASGSGTVPGSPGMG